MAETTAAPAGPAPITTKAGMSRLITIFTFVLAIFIILDASLREALGKVVGYGLNPLVGFNHQYPIPTLIITGLLMATLTIIVRHLFTDYVEQVRSQKIVAAFNKELQKARKENNTFKMKKLMAEQPKIMQKSMQQTTQQFKLLPVSMVIVIPIFAWLSVFVNALPSDMLYYSVPWSHVAYFKSTYVMFPEWVLLYSLITVPFGQVLSRGLRFFSFRKRLKELKAAQA